MHLHAKCWHGGVCNVRLRFIPQNQDLLESEQSLHNAENADAECSTVGTHKSRICRRIHWKERFALTLHSPNLYNIAQIALKSFVWLKPEKVREKLQSCWVKVFSSACAPVLKTLRKHAKYYWLVFKLGKSRKYEENLLIPNVLANHAKISNISNL